MTTELDLLRLRQLQHTLEVASNLQQRILGVSFSDRPCPQTNSEESFAHIDDHAHDFIVTFVLERLTDCGQLSMQPQLIDIHEFLVLERVRPFPAVLVLRIFPLRSHALLEEMVVGFDGQIVAGSDIVLAEYQKGKKNRSGCRTYIDAPEFLHRVERDHFFEQVIPVVAFSRGWLGEP